MDTGGTNITDHAPVRVDCNSLGGHHIPRHGSTNLDALRLYLGLNDPIALYHDALIETRSLIHALIDFTDGSTTAHFAHANMQLPIAYAVQGRVEEQILKPVNLLEVGSLEFREITTERYPIWAIKNEIMKNPKRGVVVNAANEAAIERFINGDIGFMDISRTIIDAYERFDSEPKNIDDVFALDDEVRSYYRKSL